MSLHSYSRVWLHKRSFAEELRRLVERYGLKWHEEVETVGNGFSATAGH